MIDLADLAYQQEGIILDQEESIKELVDTVLERDRTIATLRQQISDLELRLHLAKAEKSDLRARVGSAYGTEIL